MDYQEILIKFRTDYCGLGSNNLKRMLNSVGKQNSFALMFRKILEIDECNIKLNLYPGYNEFLNRKKIELIQEMQDICHRNKKHSYSVKIHPDNLGYTIIFRIYKSVVVYFFVGEYSGYEKINIMNLEDVIKFRFRSNIAYKKKTLAQTHRNKALRKYNESRRKHEKEPTCRNRSGKRNREQKNKDISCRYN